MQNLHPMNPAYNPDSLMNVVRLSVEISNPKEISIYVNAEWSLFVWGDRCYYNHGEHIYRDPGIYTIYIFTTHLRKLILNQCHCLSLSLEECPELIALDCENNQLKNLTFDAASGLQFLKCGHNAFTQLDLSPCQHLISLECNDCYLEKILLPSSQDLRYIQCRNNRLQEGLMQLTTQLPGYPVSQGTLDCSGNPGCPQIDWEKVKSKGWES